LALIWIQQTVNWNVREWNSLNAVSAGCKVQTDVVFPDSECTCKHDSEKNCTVLLVMLITYSVGVRQTRCLPVPDTMCLTLGLPGREKLEPHVPHAWSWMDCGRRSSTLYSFGFSPSQDLLSVKRMHETYEQESWAIAKMTARWALYMGALNIFESPWVRPRLYTCPELFNGLLFRSFLWMCVQNLKCV